MRDILFGFGVYLIPFALASLFPPILQAQKPLIDIGIEKNWPGIVDFKCSNNGRYFVYNVAGPLGTNLLVQPSNLKWEVSIGQANGESITQNSTKVLFKKGDSLGILDLSDSHSIKYITGVSEFAMVNNGRFNDLLLYKLKQLPNELIIQDLGNSRERRFAGVENYWYDSEGTVLVVESKKVGNASNTYCLN